MAARKKKAAKTSAKAAPAAKRAAPSRAEASPPPAAKRVPLPAYRAQLATLVDAAPSGDAWLHEIKLDGYRIGAILKDGNVRLESRRGNDWTAQFPRVADAAKKLKAQTALLDGEVAILLPSGITSFQALQNAGTSGSLVYFVFDLLHLNGSDVSALPLEQRKELLRSFLETSNSGDIIRYTDHFLGDGERVFKRACSLGCEGIVSKRRSAVYRPGRNSEWLKTKCVHRQEFVIAGYTDPEGTRAGIGAPRLRTELPNDAIRRLRGSRAVMRCAARARRRGGRGRGDL